MSCYAGFDGLGGNIACAYLLCMPHTKCYTFEEPKESILFASFVKQEQTRDHRRYGVYKRTKL